MYERLGGEALRRIVTDFVGRMTSDIMIGFFFRSIDHARLVELELEHAARALGAKIPYTGRPLREAHSTHRIMGGQFARRKTILAHTLRDHGVPEDIVAYWLDHTEKLRPLVTNQGDRECVS